MSKFLIVSEAQSGQQAVINLDQIVCARPATQSGGINTTLIKMTNGDYISIATEFAAVADRLLAEPIWLVCGFPRRL